MKKMYRFSRWWIALVLLVPLAAYGDGLKDVPAEGVGTDSLRHDSILLVGTPFYGGWRSSDYTMWPLHEGLNASLSLSATVGVGGKTPSGVGFGRDVGMVYASPLGKRLVYTLGANSSQMDWGGWNYNQAGVGGTLNYMLNDKVSFSLAGYKELVHPVPFEGRSAFHRDNYVGGAVNMKFTDNIFIQISVGTSTWKY